jgi:hypothetical protein
MTPERIAELRALAAAATPGPWTYQERESNGLRTTRWVRGNNSEWVADLPGAIHLQRDKEQDAAFIAAARTALPEALDEIERLNRAIGEHP